jgi:hypothetical protein
MRSPVAARPAVVSLALVAAVALVLLAVGCGGGGGGGTEQQVSSSSAARCPAAAAVGWQRLADQVDADVYCPRWMPTPLDAVIGGRYRNTRAVSSDRSWLVSFLFVEREAGGVSDEVHVNFRGYPESTEVPTCQDTRTDGGRTTRVDLPCFSDPRGTKEVGGETVTVYTVNQGIDQWHVLYAWEHDDGLYTLSQHVIGIQTLTRVTRNLDRIMRSLVRLEPATT